jgi:hypothetical protein
VIFDPKTRQYIDKGRIVPPQEIRDQIEVFIDEEKDEVDRQSKKVLLGTLTLAAFFALLRDKIKSWHSVVGVIAYGGQSQMNLDRWHRINDKVQRELGFLDAWQVQAEKGFARTRELASQAANIAAKDSSVPSGLEAVVEREVRRALTKSNAAERTSAVKEAVNEALADSVSTDIADEVAIRVAKDLLDSQNLEDLIWGSMSSRGRVYADSIYSTYANSQKARESDAGAVGVRRVCLNDSATCDDCPGLATEDYVSMDEITDIGEGCACLSNCRCDFEFSYLNVEPLQIDREVYA